MNENLEYAEDWILEQLIKADFEEKGTGKVIYVKVKKKDLYKLFMWFIKLIKSP